MDKGEEKEFSIENCVLNFLNTILILGGNGIIAIGILKQIYISNIGIFTNDIISNTPIIIISIGIAVAVISVFYFCVLTKQKFFCMTLCSILFAIVFIIQITIGIGILVKRDEGNNIIKNNMYKTLMTYEVDEVMKKNWNKLQKSKKCCGVGNTSDWIIFTKASEIPRSCCSENTIKCSIPFSKNSTLFKNGCFEKITREINFGINIYEIVNSIVCVLEFEIVLYGHYYIRVSRKIKEFKKPEESETSESSES
ncbi:CD63 antigen-like isoform X1 [Centruroides sculpturatus]|uniref:CD63 antigen-like isoform X1 n=2 Tax=Centruroides sculpturatus TaxID=218467 RepID=UPI000C6E951E|nr:CD63 antigen-like isoform X1 [Centruroides sculpturatus]